MKSYFPLLLLLLTTFSSLSAQGEVITIPIENVGARGNLGEFSFLPNGEFIRFARNGVKPGSQIIHEVTHPKDSPTLISESWTFRGEEGPKGIHLTKHTMRVQDSLIERTVRTVGNTLYREAVYTLDENGRPVQLKITQEKTEEEAQSYEVNLFEYVWNGTAEVEIKPQGAEGAHYSVKKKKRSLVVDKKVKKEGATRTTIGYNKYGKLDSVTKMGGAGSRMSFVRRKDGLLKGVMLGPFSATTAGQLGKFVWGIRRHEDVAALPEATIKRITAAILEELVLKDRDYRLLFPKVLEVF